MDSEKHVTQADTESDKLHTHSTSNYSEPRVFGPFALFILPLPILPASIIALARGNLVHFLTCSAALALIGFAVKLLRTGQRRELQLRRLGWTRISQQPWKSGAALCIGAAVTACALLIAGLAPWAALCFGALGTGGMLLTYGKDELTRAHAPPADDTRPEVTAALDEARLKIAAIDTASSAIENQELKKRIRRINANAVDILTTIADDPAALSRARRFLNVYLGGVQQVTTRYAQLHQAQDNQVLEQNFRNVLITIEDSFSRQQQKLREKEVLDLDVQIEVLNTQLKNEGVS